MTLARFVPTLFFFVASSVVGCKAFVVRPQCSTARNMDTSINGFFDKVGEMFEELDAFVDDAMSRRLGAGAAFYGKRKSNFYGENDKGRKRDRSMPDPTGEFNMCGRDYVSHQ